MRCSRASGSGFNLIAKSLAYHLCIIIIIIIILPWSCAHGPDPQNSRETPALEENMYARLLVCAVSGSLCPAHTRDKTTSRKQLESIYEALRVTWEEEIRGDFVEVGDWRGEASIFAACVIKQLILGRDVWVLGR
jgi:hypothetical protein